MKIQVHDRDKKIEDTEKAPATQSDIFNSHGIARLDLSDLLWKQSIKEKLPIRCCASYLLQNMTIEHGHYSDANSQLKVQAEIAYPLNSSCCKLEGPFGRIVYIFHYDNVSTMTRLRSEVLRINALAFDLGSRSMENIATALSNYNMNFKHNEDEDLDFVTGFHVQDKRVHIIVLEGLKHKAVKRLSEAVPMK